MCINIKFTILSKPLGPNEDLTTDAMAKKDYKY